MSCNPTSRSEKENRGKFKITRWRRGPNAYLQGQSLTSVPSPGFLYPPRPLFNYKTYINVLPITSDCTRLPSTHHYTPLTFLLLLNTPLTCFHQHPHTLILTPTPQSPHSHSPGLHHTPLPLFQHPRTISHTPTPQSGRTHQHRLTFSLPRTANACPCTHHSSRSLLSSLNLTPALTCTSFVSAALTHDGHVGGALRGVERRSLSHELAAVYVRGAHFHARQGDAAPIPPCHLKGTMGYECR